MKSYSSCLKGLYDYDSYNSHCLKVCEREILETIEYGKTNGKDSWYYRKIVNVNGYVESSKLQVKEKTLKEFKMTPEFEEKYQMLQSELNEHREQERLKEEEEKRRLEEKQRLEQEKKRLEEEMYENNRQIEQKIIAEQQELENECKEILLYSKFNYAAFKFEKRLAKRYFDEEGRYKVEPADNYKFVGFSAKNEKGEQAACFKMHESEGLYYIKSFFLIKLLAEMVVNIDISDICKRCIEIKQYFKNRDIIVISPEDKFEIVNNWLIVPIIFDEKEIIIKFYSDRITNSQINFDEMEGHQFEQFCAGILKANGYKDITITKESGDQGIDIIAFRDGIKHGIQCKCYSSDVGNKAVQEVFAGRSFYECHVGIVMTNQYFTKSAKELASKNGIVLWDRTKLVEFVENAKTD